MREMGKQADEREGRRILIVYIIITKALHIHITNLVDIYYKRYNFTPITLSLTSFPISFKLQTSRVTLHLPPQPAPLPHFVQLPLLLLIDTLTLYSLPRC